MSRARVLLGHGSGGKLTHQLIESLFVAQLSNPALEARDDSAVCLVEDPQGTLHPSDDGRARIAFTTDSYVVRPLFWPGGDIGRLAVCGTVNDLAMVGATPLYLSAGFILEEGLPLATLRRITASLREAAREAGVKIVAGDTKVVERGSADGLFIKTAGGGGAPGVVKPPRQSAVAIRIHEEKIPVDQEVAAACEVLGYDPLYVANEGKLIALVAPQDALAILEAMRKLDYGRQATIIGEVLPEPSGKVLMATRVGGTRIVDMLSGEQFPRIC